jgi:hypothetical protein
MLPSQKLCYLDDPGAVQHPIIDPAEHPILRRNVHRAPTVVILTTAPRLVWMTNGMPSSASR